MRNIFDSEPKIEFCWVSQVEMASGSWLTVADCQDSRVDAIQATRNWFLINNIEPEPFQVYRRVLSS